MTKILVHTPQANNLAFIVPAFYFPSLGKTTCTIVFENGPLKYISVVNPECLAKKWLGPLKIWISITSVHLPALKKTTKKTQAEFENFFKTGYLVYILT